MDNFVNTKIEEELKRVYKDGLNVYTLLYKLKRQLKWSKEQKFPDEVLMNVCGQYFKDKSRIRNKWAWFVRVIKSECEQYFAKKSIEEGDKWKRQPTALSMKEVMGKMK